MKEKSKYSALKHKIQRSSFNMFRKNSSRESGAGIMEAMIALASLAIVMASTTISVRNAFSTLKDRNSLVDAMYLRQWFVGRIDCPFTLGRLGPIQSSCSGQEVEGRRMITDPSLNNMASFTHMSPEVSKYPYYTGVEVADPFNQSTNVYQVRLVCEGNGAPVQLRPQFRKYGANNWKDLLPPPYIVCEYGPGVRDYMKTRSWP